MNPTSAANAYAAMARQVANTQAGGKGMEVAAPNGNPTGEGFASMVQEAVSGAVDTMRGADQMSAQAVAGNADLVDVVTAIAETEVTMETIVGLRDRVIGAYESIMRMPI